MDQKADAQSELDLLKKHSLLQGLTEEQILLLKERSKMEKFLPNELIIEEGEKTTDVYLILEGETNILKWDEQHCSEVLIGKIGKGQTFGEMSFMDNSPRSTTIKAAKPLTVMKLSKEMLNAMKDILSQIYSNIAIININRLRTSNQNYVKKLQENQSSFQIRQTIGKFLIYQYLIFGLIVALIAYIFFPESQIYLPWMVAVIPAFAMIKQYNFPFLHFGLTPQGLITNISVSMLATALIIGVIVIVSTFFSSTPNAFFQWSLEKNMLPLSVWPFYIAYSFAQEFVARGVLQSALQDFLTDEKGMQTLFVNAAFLFVLLLPLGFDTAIELFLVGLPLGLLYLKQKSIWGNAILHSILLCLGILNI